MIAKLIEHFSVYDTAFPTTGNLSRQFFSACIYYTSNGFSSQGKYT